LRIGKSPVRNGGLQLTGFGTHGLIIYGVVMMAMFHAYRKGLCRMKTNALLKLRDIERGC